MKSSLPSTLIMSGLGVRGKQYLLPNDAPEASNQSKLLHDRYSRLNINLLQPFSFLYKLQATHAETAQQKQFHAEDVPKFTRAVVCASIC